MISHTSLKDCLKGINLNDGIFLGYIQGVSLVQIFGRDMIFNLLQTVVNDVEISFYLAKCIYGTSNKEK